MSKTVFQTDSHFTPDFMAAYYGTDATTGHTHDGLDEDGSVPRIETEDLLDTTGTFDAILRAADILGGSPSAVTWAYRKSGNEITLYINETLDLSDSTECQIEPATTWPDAIIPTTAQYLSVSVPNAQSYTTILSPGLIQIPSDTTTNMILWCMDPDESVTNTLEAAHFSSSNIVYKGLSRQSITYWID